MSRLDFITIIIVVICLAAIIFLVYKMTDLFRGKEKKPETIENPIDSTSMADDATYPYDLDSTTVTDSDLADSLDAGYEDENYFTDAKEENTPTSYKGDSSGKYLVIAGSFEYKHNADNFAGKLRQMGYEKATTKIFDRGKYAVVLVDRFDDFNAAKKLAAELNDKHHIEAFVQNVRKKITN